MARAVPAMDNMQAFRDLTSTLWSIRATQETARVLRTTYSMLRFFLFFDICYLISGIALVTMALTNQIENRNQMVLYGGLFGLFASISAVCNFLASHGLRTWRRALLLPWLLFFLLVLGLLTMNMIRDLWCHRVQWRHVFLFFANLMVFSCWRHMQRQFLLMSLPRPGAMVLDVEAVLRETLQPLPGTCKDAPPRYEEVQGEELPPRYEEATRVEEVAREEEAREEKVTKVEEAKEATVVEGGWRDSSASPCQ